MRELFNKIDKNLRLYRPVLWGLKIHYLIPFIILGFLLSFIYGFLQNPSVYEDYDQGLAIAIAYVFAIVGLVFWLVYVFRFNKWKEFGIIRKGEGLLHFLLVWVLIYAMSLIPMGMEFGRYVKTSLLFSKTEIANDMNTFSMNYWRLSMTDYDDILSENIVFRKDSNEWWEKNRSLERRLNLTHFPEPGTYNVADDSVIVSRDRIKTYRFSSFEKVDFVGSYTTPSEARFCYKGRELYNRLKAEGRPWYTKSEKWDSKALNKPDEYIQAILTLKKKYFNYSELSKGELAAWLYLDGYYRDYEYDQEPDGSNPWYFYVLSKEQIKYQQFIKSEIEDLGDHLEEVAKYRMWPSNRDVHFWLHSLFYVCMGLTILYFIFRHVTLKTFGVSFGVGFLVSAVYGILLGLLTYVNRGGGNNYTPFILYFVFIGVFLLLALQIRNAKKRSIFHGMGLNYVFVTLPSLGFVVSMFMYEVLSAPYRGAYILNPYSRETFAGWGEIIGLAVFIASIEVFHRVYLKWYSLPEE